VEPRPLLLFVRRLRFGGPVLDDQATPGRPSRQPQPGATSSGRNGLGKDGFEVTVISPRRTYPAAAIVVLLLFGAEPALGSASCSVAATGVSFGAYDISLVTPDDSTGDVTVTCSYVPPGGATGVNIQVSLSPGVSGSYSPRQMAFGPARLNYNLYRDAARTSIWGNGLSGTGIATDSATVGP